jgi:hypothetical protein
MRLMHKTARRSNMSTFERSYEIFFPLCMFNKNKRAKKKEKEKQLFFIRFTVEKCSIKKKLRLKIKE